MSAEKGQSAKLHYGTGVVGGITSLSWSVDGNVIEKNNFDVAAFTEALLGRRTVTISVSGELDREDTTGQTALRADFLDGDVSLASDFDTFKIGPETPTTGDVSFSGAGIVTSYSEERGDDELATYSAEIRISGAWTEATEA